MTTKQIPGPDGNLVDAEVVDVDQSTDRWCEYKLEDGAVIRAKPIIIGFLRVPGQYDPEGNPLYAIRGGVTHAIVSVPDSLKKQEH